VTDSNTAQNVSIRSQQHIYYGQHEETRRSHMKQKRQISDIITRDQQTSDLSHVLYEEGLLVMAAPIWKAVLVTYGLALRSLLG